MKTIYIHVFAACCLAATFAYASENQGRGVIARHPVAVALRNVSTIGQEKPIIFPFTNHDLFDAHKNPAYEPKDVYERNTKSHPAYEPKDVHERNTKSHKASLRIVIPTEDKFPSAEKIFAPNESKPTTPSLSEIYAPAGTRVDSPFVPALLMLTDIERTPVTEETPTNDGYESSDFEDSKHVPAGKLSGSRFTILAERGFGYSYRDSAVRAIKKQGIPEAPGKSVKFKNKKTELGAALTDLSGATAEDVDTIITYAAKQQSGIVEPAALSAALQVAKQLELANLTTNIDPLLLATRAQAARVKAAQEALKKEQEALTKKEQELSANLPKATHRFDVTNTALKALGYQLPQAPEVSDDVPTHERIAAEIAARKASLLAKPTPSASAASSTTK